MSLNTITEGAYATWNDSTVYGDVNSLHYQELLTRSFSVLAGQSSRQKEGTWRIWTPTYHQLLNETLTVHQPARNKDGAAIVFAKGVPNGRRYQGTMGYSWKLSGRTKYDISAISFAGFDVDDGTSLEAASEKLMQMGLAGVVYTTSSHGKRTTDLARTISNDETWSAEYAKHEALEEGLKNPVVQTVEFPDANGKAKATILHDPIDKYRVVLPLKTPFLLMPNDRRVHDSLCEEWRSRAAEFGDQVLNLGIDSTGCDVNRLFYTPRHQPMADDWFVGVYAGRPLAIEKMNFRARNQDKTTRISGKRSAVHNFAKACRPVLSDGFDLIDWRRNWGHCFNAVSFFDSFGWDFRRVSGEGDEATIECPNDVEHSNACDSSDMACWIRNGDGHGSFALSCRHEHCAEFGALEHLLLIEQQIDLPDGIEYLSQLLCDREFYQPLAGDKLLKPNRQSYLRWDATTSNKEVVE